MIAELDSKNLEKVKKREESKVMILHYRAPFQVNALSSHHCLFSVKAAHSRVAKFLHRLFPVTVQLPSLGAFTQCSLQIPECALIKSTQYFFCNIQSVHRYKGMNVEKRLSVSLTSLTPVPLQSIPSKVAYSSHSAVIRFPSNGGDNQNGWQVKVKFMLLHSRSCGQLPAACVSQSSHNRAIGMELLERADDLEDDSPNG
jgi:hypothetical protein